MAIRQQRESVYLSQKELGGRLKTSQPRVAKTERTAADVSLDQLVRALTAAGGGIVVKQSVRSKGGKARPSKSKQAGELVLEVTTSK